MAAIWGTEVSHDSRQTHTVTCTNCTITVRACLPRCDTCPKNTKRHLLKRFAEKLERRASIGHLWSHVTPNLIRSAPSNMKQDTPRQRLEELSFLVLCLPQTSTRLGAIIVQSPDVEWKCCDLVRKGYDVENRWEVNIDVRTTTSFQTVSI